MSAGPPSRPQSLDDYPEYAQAVVEQNPQMNESNTKHKLVSPLLGLLGWDMALDMELEYSVQMGQTTKHVDYSLSLEGTPAVFVEAKGCDSDLNDGNREQLQSYLKQQNVDWGLLTNGKEYEVFRRRFSDQDIVIDNLGSVSLEDFIHQTGLLETLSKKSIQSGESERIAANIREIREARRGLLNNKDQLAEGIMQVITAQIGDNVSQRIEPHAKSFIDELTQSLGSEVRSLPDADRGNIQSDPVDPGRNTGDEQDFWAQVETETGIQYEDEQIKFPENKSATETFASFAQHLIKNGHLTNDDLPLQFGRKRYLVNTDPIHSDGEKMKSPKEVKDGIFVETHNSTDGLQRNAEQLADYCFE